MKSNSFRVEKKSPSFSEAKYACDLEQECIELNVNFLFSYRLAADEKYATAAIISVIAVGCKETASLLYEVK